MFILNVHKCISVYKCLSVIRIFLYSQCIWSIQDGNSIKLNKVNFFMCFWHIYHLSKLRFVGLWLHLDLQFLCLVQLCVIKSEDISFINSIFKGRSQQSVHHVEVHLWRTQCPSHCSYCAEEPYFLQHGSLPYRSDTFCICLWAKKANKKDHAVLHDLGSYTASVGKEDESWKVGNTVTVYQ